jgi:hypothetical protein
VQRQGQHGSERSQEDKPYPNHIFMAVIWGRDRPKFGTPETLLGKQVCTTGVIKLYRERPEIILHDPSQLTQANGEAIYFRRRRFAPQKGPSPHALTSRLCRDALDGNWLPGAICWRGFHHTPRTARMTTSKARACGKAFSRGTEEPPSLRALPTVVRRSQCLM